MSVCRLCPNCKQLFPNSTAMNTGLVPSQAQRLIPLSAIGSELPKIRSKRSIAKQVRKRKRKVRSKIDVVGRGSGRKCVKPCKKVKLKKSKPIKQHKPKKGKKKGNKNGTKARIFKQS